MVMGFLTRNPQLGKYGDQVGFRGRPLAWGDTAIRRGSGKPNSQFRGLINHSQNAELNLL